MPCYMMLTAFVGILVCANAAPAQEKADLADRLARLPATLLAANKSDAEIIDAMILATLIRTPKDHEKAGAKKLFERTAKRRDAVEQLLWTVVNTKEFMELHRLSDFSPEQWRQFSDRFTKARHEK